jgi:sugar lactone lactonase YvrE
MKSLFSVICMVVVVAALSACGGSSNSTNGVVYGTPASTVSKPSTPTLLGGSTQGGAALASFSNVSTTAGVAGSTIAADPVVDTRPRFNQPNGVTTDGTNLFIADYKNHTIRQMVIATGVVTTVAGVTGVPGAIDTAGGIPTFYFPNAITTDGQYLYVTGENFTVRKIDIAAKTVTTLAGSAGSSGSVDGTGNVGGVIGTARFNQLDGITTDGNNIYVSDSNNTIRWIDKVSGAVKTLAGTAGSLGSKDGAPGVAQFNRPTRITCDGPYLYVCDFFNRTVRRIDIASGSVLTIAGKADTAPSIDDAPPAPVGTDARFNQPNGITTDGSYLYVSDSYNNTIRRINLNTPYAVDKIAGITFDQNKYKTPTQISPGSVNSARGTPSFDTPLGITTDGTTLFVADSNNHLIRSIK